MARKHLTPGNPPLLWNSVKEAFDDINTNFLELYASVGSGNAIDLTQLETSMIPGTTGDYVLGQYDKRWKEVHINEYISGTGETNGLWLGLAQIKGMGSTVDLPINSTVGGELINNPDYTFFKEVQVDNDSVVVANEVVDSINLLSGTAIRMSVDSSAESITIDNIGVTTAIAGQGISVSSATGAVTVRNTGVLSLTNGSVLPPGLASGSGIKASSSTGNIVLTNTGVIDIDQGYGITVSRDDSTGIVTITNSAPMQVAFRTLYVTGTNLVTDGIVADSTSDQLNFTAGYGMILTPTAVNDTLTFSIDQHIDIYGSVFAPDSSVMVDTIDQKINAVGGFTGDLTGDVVGNVTGNVQGDVTGDVTGNVTTNSIVSTSGNIVIEADNYVTINSANNGQLEIGTASGAGNVIIGNKTNGTDVNINGDVIMDAGTTITGDLIGDVTGNISGTAHTGNLTGNVTGNVVGNVVGDLTGSVFADDSTMIVNSTDGTVHAKIYTQSVVHSTLESVGGSDASNPTALDLTKSVQVLDSADTNDDTFSLADGEEGQIMYFVPKGTSTAGIYIIVDNARRWNATQFETTATFAWVPFDVDGGTNFKSLAMAVFTDGAWNLDGYVAG